MDGHTERTLSPVSPESLAKLSDDALFALLRTPVPVELVVANALRLSTNIFLLPTEIDAASVAINTPISQGSGTDSDSDVKLLISLLDPPQQPDELARLPGYRLLRVLGVGGMGIVFQAEDLKLNRHVAIKLIRPKRFKDKLATQRFLTEARSAAKLTNDHIVTVYHVGQHGELPYLVMQLLTGQSLADRMRQEKKLEFLATLQIARQIAQGLAAAHAEGMLHRDIKPDNIWLEAPSDRVKILDFGLAQLAHPNAELSDDAVLAGTPNYIAPERIRGQAGDPRSDLFSLGVVLYEMLSGHKPFQASGVTGTLQLGVHHDPEPLPPLTAPFDSQTRLFISKLLEKDPESRTANAADVVEQIDEILNLGTTDKRLTREAFELTHSRDRFRVRLRWIFAALVLASSAIGIFLITKFQLDEIEGERLKIRAQTYPIKIKEADDAWKEGHIARLGEVLDELIPKGRENDLRGWEWYYLNSFREKHAEVVHENSAGFSAIKGVGDVVAWVENGSSVIHIRNIATNESLADIEIPGETIVALALSGDTARVACSLKSKRIEVWDIAKQKRLMSVPSPLAYLALNSSGDRLVSGAGEKITVYEVNSGRVLRQFPQEYFVAETGPIAFSPDDKYCAVGLLYPAFLLIYDAQSWEELARFTPYNGASNSGYFGISWHPDSRQIAVGHGPGSLNGGVISIWNWSDGEVKTTFPAFQSGLSERIATIAFDAKGELLAVGEIGGALTIFNAVNGERASTFPPSIGEFVTLGWSSEHQIVNSGSLAGAITRFNWAAMRPYLTIDATGRSDWTSDGKTIVSKAYESNVDAHETTVKVFDPANGHLLSKFSSPKGNWIPAIACCPIDDRIAYSSLVDDPTSPSNASNGSIFIFIPGKSQPEVSIPAPFIKSLDWSPDGKYLVGGQVHIGHSVTVWDVETGDVLWTRNEHNADVETVVWSADNQLIASKDERGKVLLREPRTGQVIRELIQDSFQPLIEDGQWNLAFSPDSQRLAVGYKESLKIWDVQSGRVTLEIRAHAKNILAVSWSRDGQRIATGGRDYFTNIWNAETGQLLLSFKEESDVALVAFSPNGQYLATHAAPIGRIKIRRAFVKGIETPAGSAAKLEIGTTK